MNDEVVEVAKFVASKLDNVGIAPKKALLKFSIDKKKTTIEAINVNFLVNQFFRLLKTFFGFAAADGLSFDCFLFAIVAGAASSYVIFEQAAPLLRRHLFRYLVLSPMEDD